MHFRPNEFMMIYAITMSANELIMIGHLFQSVTKRMKPFSIC